MLALGQIQAVGGSEVINLDVNFLQLFPQSLICIFLGDGGKAIGCLGAIAVGILSAIPISLVGIAFPVLNKLDRILTNIQVRSCGGRDNAGRNQTNQHDQSQNETYNSLTHSYLLLYTHL